MKREHTDSNGAMIKKGSRAGRMAKGKELHGICGALRQAVARSVREYRTMKLISQKRLALDLGVAE